MSLDFLHLCELTFQSSMLKKNTPLLATQFNFFESNYYATSKYGKSNQGASNYNLIILLSSYFKSLFTKISFLLLATSTVLPSLITRYPPSPLIYLLISFRFTTCE